MPFQKIMLNEELKKAVEALIPAMRKLNFVGGGSGPYWDQFYHQRAAVTVKVVPFKEPKAWGSYGGFKLRIERGQHPGRGSSTVLVKIDNLGAVKAAVTESIKYIRGLRVAARRKKNFKETLEKTLPRLFPGRDASVYSADFGDLHVSMLSEGKKPSVSFNISPSGVIRKVEISYPGKDLDVVAKLLEAW